MGDISGVGFKFLVKVIRPWAPATRGKWCCFFVTDVMSEVVLGSSKTTSLMMSLTKNPHPQAKNFFSICFDLADLFEPLNSSLLQSAEELGRW